MFFEVGVQQIKVAEISHVTLVIVGMTVGHFVKAMRVNAKAACLWGWEAVGKAGGRSRGVLGTGGKR